MDYRHLDEQIKFLVEVGVDDFSDLYRVIGRDELEKYRTSTIEESSRPLLNRLEALCKFSTRHHYWKNAEAYKHPNHLSREAMSDIEWEWEEEYEEYGDSWKAEIVKKMLKDGEILYDKELGSYRRSDEHYESYGMDQIRNRGLMYEIFSDYPSELQEFLNRILERKGIVSYDESKHRWILRGASPDYAWLDNMIVLKVIQGYDRIERIWDALGDEINDRYPIVKWSGAYCGYAIPGIKLLDERLGVLYRSGKVGINPVTGNLEFRHVQRT